MKFHGFESIHFPYLFFSSFLFSFFSHKIFKTFYSKGNKWEMFDRRKFISEKTFFFFFFSSLNIFCERSVIKSFRSEVVFRGNFKELRQLLLFLFFEIEEDFYSHFATPIAYSAEKYNWKLKISFIVENLNR